MRQRRDTWGEMQVVGGHDAENNSEALLHFGEYLRGDAEDYLEHYIVGRRECFRYGNGRRRMLM